MSCMEGLIGADLASQCDKIKFKSDFMGLFKTQNILFPKDDTALGK